MHQACIAVRNSHYFYAYILFCDQGDETVVEFLYLNGAKVNVCDGRGLTPLHLAVMNDDAR